MYLCNNVFVKLTVIILYFFSTTCAMANTGTASSNSSLDDTGKKPLKLPSINSMKNKEEVKQKFKEKFSAGTQDQMSEMDKEIVEMRAMRQRMLKKEEPVKPDEDSDASNVSFGVGSISLYEFKQKLSDFGTADYYRGGEKEIVLCIEDNAGSYTNQKKISKFVDTVLALQQGIPLTKTVASERNVHDYAGFVSFPDKDMLSYLRDYLVQQNMISGVEHFFVDNLSETFLFSLYNKDFNISLYKALNDLHSQREIFYRALDDFKRWIEDIEAYIVLETNLSDYRKSEIVTFFKRYYDVLEFFRRYCMMEASVDEILDYLERKDNYFSVSKIVSDIDDALRTMNINFSTDYNTTEVRSYLVRAEHLYSKVFQRKKELVADFMELVKKRGDQFSILVVEKGFSEIIKREFKRRSVSYIWFSDDDMQNQYPDANDMILPASNKFEDLIMHFLKSWKDKDTFLKSDFFGKRSRSFVSLTSIFHYLFLRMNKLKDSFRHDLYRAAHLIEKDKEKIILGIKSTMDERLRTKKMFETQKDYLNIREMNEVNMEVSRKINEMKNIFDRIIIDYDKIMINTQNQMRIPFLLEMRGEDKRLAIVIGKDVRAELKEAKYLLEKGILDESIGLSYKLIYDFGVGMEDDYRLMGKMFDNQGAIEKVGDTLKQIEDEAALAYKEVELYSEAEKATLIQDTKEISNKIGAAAIQTVIHNFDAVYKTASDEIKKIFKLYDKMKLPLKDIIRLAEISNTKNRKTFVFYVDRDTRVELAKDVTRLYIADFFSKSLDYRVSEFIKGIDIAFSQADLRLVRFRTKALENIIYKYDDMNELKKVFYLSLFSQPFFKMDRDKLIKRKNVVGLFDHLRTRLILFNIILSHPKLTVEDAEFFAGFIVDTFFKSWKDVKRKEHRQIFDWEKEDLLDFERMLMRAVMVQLKINIIKEEFAAGDLRPEHYKYKDIVERSEILSKQSDYDFISNYAKNSREKLIEVSFPKATIWKKIFMPKKSFHEFARFALKKQSILRRWKDFVSFDSLFEHESLTTFWYENLGKTDILSKIYTGLVINMRDLIKVMRNLYILESETLPYRFLISFDKNQKVEKLYIEKVTKSRNEVVFLPFSRELVDNRFDRKVVDDIYDKVRFVLDDDGVLNQTSREVSDVLLFEPVLESDGNKENVKAAVNYDHILSYITDSCMRMERKAPRKLSLGRGVYIMRNFEDVRQRIDRIYHFVSNSFLVRRNSVDIFDSVLHEMIHYWFYLFSFAEKKDETWIRGPYLFFNVPDKYEMFFKEFVLIDGLDIDMEKRNYFKVSPEKLIEYRKAEELIALLIEAVFQGKTSLDVDLFDGRRLYFPLATEDIQILVWNNMLPFWMSPEGIGHDEEYITADYYYKVFETYVNLLKKNNKKDRLVKFLDYSRNTLTKDKINERSLAFANGYLFCDVKDKAYDIVVADIETALKKHLREKTLTRREYRAFCNILEATIKQLSPEQVIDLLKHFDRYFSQIQQFYFLFETDSETSQYVAFKFIVSYFMRNSFKLPKLAVVKEINHDLAVFMDKYFKNSRFFYVCDLFDFFTTQNVAPVYTDNVLTRYLSFSFIAKSLENYILHNFYFVAAGFLKNNHYFYMQKQVDLLKDMYDIFDYELFFHKFENSFFKFFFAYELAVWSSTGL